jgi:hypothetical protein
MKRSTYSAWLRNLFAMIAVIALFGFGLIPKPAHADTTCVGDCNSDSQVTVDEILTMVNIALGTIPLTPACPAGDANNDGQITVDEILTAVNNALSGCPTSEARCGDGHIDTDLGEECDNGGVCLGGSHAGEACKSEDDCGAGENGVCVLGSNAESACDPADPDACPGGTCLKCQAQGGKGCAANCTEETNIEMDLVPGVLSGTGVAPGTSGSVVYTDTPLGALVLPFQEGTKQTLAFGKMRDGIVPAVVLADTVFFPEIPIQSLACACVRGVADKTCGGYLQEATGNCSLTTTTACTHNSDCPSGETCAHTFATDCTPGYVAGTCHETSPQSCSADTECPEVTLPDQTKLQKCVGNICADCRVDSDCAGLGGGTCDMHACDGKNPCWFVTGPGTSGSEVINCGDEWPGVNLYFSEDSRGSLDPDECNPVLGGPDYVPPNPQFPLCGDPPVIAFSGTGPVGSAVTVSTTAIGNPPGACDAQPENFCTDTEPYETRGFPETLPLVTGIAEGLIYNANQINGDTICNCPFGVTGCDASECVVDDTHPHGGHTSLGIPMTATPNVCTGTASISGLGTAGAFTALSQNTTNDQVITNILVAK